MQPGQRRKKRKFRKAFRKLVHLMLKPSPLYVMLKESRLTRTSQRDMLG